MIRINERYIIDIDAINYKAKIDLKKVSKEGNPLYATIGYYRTLKAAILAIYEREAKEVLSDGEYTLKQAVDTLSRIQEELEEELIVCDVKLPSTADETSEA